MPPKKDKKKQEPLVDYDINSMNTEDLRNYAKMLEKEIEAFRDFNSFYRQTEDEMANVFRTRQDQIKLMNEEIVNKDIEVEELKLEIQRKLEEREQKRIYEKFVRDKCQKFQEANSKIKSDKILDQYHQELTAKLREKEIKFETEKRKILLERKEAMEENVEKVKHSNDFNESLWNNAIRNFDDKLTETVKFYGLSQEMTRAEALEAKRQGENSFDKACKYYKQTLKDYFQQNIRQDFEILKSLETKAMELRQSIDSTKLRLIKINTEDDNKASENEEHYSFETAQHQTDYKNIDTLGNKNRKIQKIKNENKILEDKIKQTEDQTTKLRDQFTQILYKVHQNAEKEAKLIKENLNSLLNSKKND